MNPSMSNSYHDDDENGGAGGDLPSPHEMPSYDYGNYGPPPGGGPPPMGAGGVAPMGGGPGGMEHNVHQPAGSADDPFAGMDDGGDGAGQYGSPQYSTPQYGSSSFDNYNGPGGNQGYMGGGAAPMREFERDEDDSDEFGEEEDDRKMAASFHGDDSGMESTPLFGQPKPGGLKDPPPGDNFSSSQPTTLAPLLGNYDNHNAGPAVIDVEQDLAPIDIQQDNLWDAPEDPPDYDHNPSVQNVDAELMPPPDASFPSDAMKSLPQKSVRFSDQQPTEMMIAENDDSPQPSKGGNVGGFKAYNTLNASFKNKNKTAMEGANPPKPPDTGGNKGGFKSYNTLNASFKIPKEPPGEDATAEDRAAYDALTMLGHDTDSDDDDDQKPRAKPGGKKGQKKPVENKFRLVDVLIVVALMLVALVVSLVLLKDQIWPPGTKAPSAMPSVMPSVMPTSAPTSTPTTMAPTLLQDLEKRRSEAFDALKQEYVSLLPPLPQTIDELIGASQNPTSTPQQKAAEWIIFNDAMALNHTEPWFLPRYALAVFYHQNVKNATDWADSNWLSDDSACTWNGILCDATTNDITKLNLPDRNLEGSLPSEIKYLTTLEEFIVQDNALRERPPWESFFELKELSTLHLRKNDFTGTLPVGIGAMESLTFLYLSDNRFSGPLPKEIFTAKNLESLELHSNDITGTFPDPTQGPPCKIMSDFTIDCTKIACSCCHPVQNCYWT